ncbi:hypothetical protein HOLleu_33800 [Holothuria leucospilota]|uniref:HYR domain-containing protein n=1 Tax=Holothuria leucospilota TaxID=206669 RepID=A0A9Q0YQT9_HOLLE|nr:hypothetical protein HOLleu_33800 [Holothuria leucospilota]
MTSLEYRSDTTAVFWGEPSTAGDSCSATSLTSSHSPGDQFTEGATVVSYLFGSTIVCNFTVQVIKEARPFPLAVPIILPVAFLLILLFFCIFCVLNMPKRLQRRPLPGVPKHQPSLINPAYQPNSSGEKDSDVGTFYDFILEEVDPETEEITSDTYGISGAVLSGDILEIIKSQDSQIGQNGQIFKQKSAEGHGEEIITEPSLTHECASTDSDRLKDKENGYSIDPGETANENEETQSHEENNENMENEDHYVIMKNLKGDVTVDNHRGEGHERAILDQVLDLDNTEDVLVLNLGEF